MNFFVLMKSHSGVSIPVLDRDLDTSGWMTSDVLGRSFSFRAVSMVILERTTVTILRMLDYAASVS